ncbi:PP2C family protein-serine/threonine phosphatase [Nocardia wallacei]|uniref:PP2C family protein-serine/threonine phosphatase n=1 Tax=Nocardia wallacei TaxID=480035 RepID=UPI002453856C|nr:protein phosphatase 2C domain-containing protein [Nocardia wallacei]
MRILTLAELDTDRGAAGLDAVQLVTDRGIVHARNEDAVAAAVLERPDGPVIVVAVSDGVSSSDDPQAASGAAVRSGVAACLAALTEDRTAEDALLRGLAAAFAAVRDLSVAEGHSPSCTYVAAVLRPGRDGEYAISVTNVGDSRAYWLAADDTGTPSRRLTSDDSFAQLLVTGGVEEESAMRDPRAHVLMHWLGADSEHVPADTPVHSLRVRGPGVLLLCSDGMWNYLPDAAGLAAVATAADPARAAQDLADYAVRSGGADNITVALAPVPARTTPRPG